MSDQASPDTGDDAREETHERDVEMLHGCPVVWSRGQRVIHVPLADYLSVAGKLHADGFLTCIDLCAVDYLTYEPDRGLPAGIEPERFEIVVQLLAHKGARRIRVRVQVPEADPTVPTLFDLYPGTEAMEREAFDLFGVTFTGHPDPNRILLPEDWVGHPLRKDEGSGRIPVQFKSSHDARRS